MFGSLNWVAGTHHLASDIHRHEQQGDNRTQHRVFVPERIHGGVVE